MLLNSTAQLVGIHSFHIFSSAQLFNRAKRWFPLHVGSDFQDHIPAKGNELTRKQFTLAPITMSSLFELAKTILRRGVCWPFLECCSVPKKTKHHHCRFFLILFLAFTAFWPVFQLLCSKSEGCARCLLALSFCVVLGTRRRAVVVKVEKIPRYDCEFLADKRNQTTHLASYFTVVSPRGISDFIPKMQIGAETTFLFLCQSAFSHSSCAYAHLGVKLSIQYNYVCNTTS